MLALDVGTPDFGRLVQDLAATEKQAQRALNSTLRKMAAWLRTRSMRGLSKELELQQRILRRRLKAAKLRVSGGGSEITVWFGLNPVGLVYLQAKQGSSGVAAAGGRFVKSAFIAKTPGGGSQVFKRMGRARLPVAAQAADVQQPAENYIAHDALGAQFDAQFWKTFEHELQWQTR